MEEGVISPTSGVCLIFIISFQYAHKQKTIDVQGRYRMAYDRDLNFIYNNPTKIVFGENSITEAGEEMARLKCGKAFLVTDKGVVDAGSEI